MAPLPGRPRLRLIEGSWSGRRDVLAAVHAGGPEGARALYDNFADTVHRLVWRLLGADAEHEDVVQQAFVGLLAGVRRVRDAEALPAWVMSVTVKTVQTEIRRRRARRVLHLSEPSSEALARGAGGADFEARDLLARVHATLDRMPAGERIAFVLRHIDGIPVGEIAEAFGWSLATAKRRISRADDRFWRLARSLPELAERLRDGAWGGSR